MQDIELRKSALVLCEKAHIATNKVDERTGLEMYAQ